MEEPTLDTPPLPKQSPQWIIAATCSALVLVATAGGIFAMRDRLLADARDSAQSQKEAMDAVDRRMDRLQASISKLENEPKLDAAAVDGLKSDLAEMKTGIEALQKHEEAIETRIKALEDSAATAQKEAEKKAAQNVATGDATELKMIALSGNPYLEQWAAWAAKHPHETAKYPHLKTFAATGIPLASDMRANLRSALKDVKLPAKIDDTSFIGKLNTHLHGLISIRKTGDSDEANALRAIAGQEDLEKTVAEIEASGALEDSKALSDWHNDYLARKQALEELDGLGAEHAHD